MNVFVDSSALAKRYVDEPGSDRVDAILETATALGVSVLCISEIVSALCRRRREGPLSRAQYARAKSALVQDIADASVIALTEAVVGRAVRLLERWPLRSSDALHIAAAAEWACDLFVSADRRQTTAARAYGLSAELVPARE